MASGEVDQLASKLPAEMRDRVLKVQKLMGEFDDPIDGLSNMARELRRVADELDSVLDKVRKKETT
jgi:hypothetical protein